MFLSDKFRSSQSSFLTSIYFNYLIHDLATWVTYFTALTIHNGQRQTTIDESHHSLQVIMI